MLHVSSLLNSSYSSESDIENIMDDCLVKFLVETNFNDFAEVFLEISKMKIKNIRWDNRKDQKILQIISFVYSRIMDFPPNNFEIKTVITKTFLDDVKNILLASHVIHHSYVTSNIIGYTHDFCNKKIREIKIQFLSLHTTYFLSIFSLLLKVQGFVFGGQNN